MAYTYFCGKIEKCRVLHVIQGRHFGGAERVVLTLTKSFNRQHIQPFVLCFSKGLLLEKLKHNGIPNFLIPMRSKKDILVPLLKTISIVRKIKIDIVHTHTVRSNLIGRLAALFTGRKCITHIHSPILRDFVDLKRGRFNQLIDCATRPVAKRLITVSDSLRNEMILSGISRKRVVTVHNALDSEYIKKLGSATKIGRGIRDEFKIPPGAFLMVIVALLRPRKGTEIIIRAMAPIVARFPNSFLLIVGNDEISEVPNYIYSLRQLASKIGVSSHIVFTGFREDVLYFLQECDLMVLPSLFGEGLPMVILEAMASGLPVIASCVEGVPEVIKDGVNGFLVRPGDSEELSKKILNLLENPLLMIDVKTKAKQMIKKMNAHRQAQKIEQIYTELLK